MRSRLEFGLSFVGDGNTQVRWRFPIAFQIIPLLAFVCCLPWMPESPRWLVKVGRDAEARAILGRLRSGGDLEGAAAFAEYEDIVGIVSLEKAHARQNSYWNMFWGSGASAASCVAACLADFPDKRDRRSMSRAESS